jgi:hypothetical protein
MEKKEYTAPKMEIVDFEHQTNLLCESCEVPNDVDYDDELG